MFDYNPTTVPPEWHGWLEGINDYTPSNYNFPKPIYAVAAYKSRTGTDQAYNPKGSWVSAMRLACACAGSHDGRLSPLPRPAPLLLVEQPVPEAQLEEGHDLATPAGKVSSQPPCAQHAQPHRQPTGQHGSSLLFSERSAAKGSHPLERPERALEDGLSLLGTTPPLLRTRDFNYQ